jgi:hypothetical protein
MEDNSKQTENSTVFIEEKIEKHLTYTSNSKVEAIEFTNRIFETDRESVVDYVLFPFKRAFDNIVLLI